VTGETVSPERDAVSFQMGWPGLTVGYLHGVSGNADVGFKVSLLYAAENTNNSTFGAGADLPLRLVVNRNQRVLVELHIEPGVRLYTKNSVSNFFTRFPVGGVLGIQATPELRIAASADLTMAINWSHTQYFEIGPLFGFGAEYTVDRSLLLGANVKFGPQFYSYTNAPTDFAFTAEIVVGYRM
jgi:hypothetical protein